MRNRYLIIAATIAVLALPAHAQFGRMVNSGEFTADQSVTSFELSSGTTGDKDFVVGVTFGEGDVPAGIATNLTDYQVTYERDWNDGSVKHAVIAGVAPLVSGTPLTVTVSKGTPPSGTALTEADIVAAAPSASFHAESGDAGTTTCTVNLSSLLGSPVRVTTAGPEFIQAKYRGRCGADTQLFATFYVKLWKSGRMHVRVVASNGFIDDGTNADSRIYTPTITIDGSTVFNNGGSPLTHYRWQRYDAEAWIGGDPTVTPKHETTYMMDTVMPHYAWRNPSEAALNALDVTYTPLDRGPYPEDLSGTGYLKHIGLYPLWDTLFLTSGADARAYGAMITAARSLATYPVEMVSEASLETAIPTDYPRWSAVGLNQGGARNWYAGTLKYDLPHGPNMAVLPYLVTGDEYFYDTMLSGAANCYFSEDYLQGEGLSRRIYGPVRYRAWCDRTLGVSAAFARTSDSIAAEYRTLYAYQMTAEKAEIDVAGMNLLGHYYDDLPYGGGAGAPWMQNFWIQTKGYLSDIDPVVDMTESIAVRDHHYWAVIGMLGPNGVDNYCFTKSSNYTAVYSPTTSTDPTTWCDTWGCVYTATFGVDNDSCGNTLDGTSAAQPESATGFYANQLPALYYAVKHGAADPNTGHTAAQSKARFLGATNIDVFLNSGFDDAPIWGIWD